MDFWKSTRKTLGASRSLYEKVISERAAIDLTGDNDPLRGPSKGKRSLSMKKDDGVAEKIARVDKRLSFLDELAQALNYVIRKSMSVAPVVSPCCQRMIGCHSSDEQWFSNA